MAVTIDESVRLAEERLRELGKWDNTMVLFMSDNGGSLNKQCPNWPMKGGKQAGSSMEGAIHVRAAMGGGYLPEVLWKTASNTVMHFVDMWPTLSFLSGLEAKKVPAGEREVDGENTAPSWRRLYETTRDNNIRSNVAIENELISGGIIQGLRRSDGIMQTGRAIIHITNQWGRGRSFSYVTRTKNWKVYGRGTAGLPKAIRQCNNWSSRCPWSLMPNQGTQMIACTDADPCIFDITTDLAENNLLRLNSHGVPTELTTIASEAFSRNPPDQTTYWTRISGVDDSITVNGINCKGNTCGGYGIPAANSEQWVDGCYNLANMRATMDILAAKDRWVIGPFRDQGK